MIESLDKLKNIRELSNFQSLILTNIEYLLKRVNLTDLSDYSYIKVNGNSITISLVHKQDSDTIVTLNIFKDYATLWYSECNIYFDNYNEDFDIGDLMKTYKNSLLGNYETTDFYFKKKLIFSSTKFLDDNIKNCIVPRTIFYRFYLKFYEKQFKLTTVKYLRFIYEE